MRYRDRVRALKQQRLLADAMRVPLRIQTSYEVALRRIAGGIIQSHRDAALAQWKSRHDAKGLDRIGQSITVAVGEETNTAFVTMAWSVAKHAKKALQPITPRLMGLEPQIAIARDTNIRLVEDAGRSYSQAVRQIIDDPNNFGVRVEDIADQLESAGVKLKGRATLIARDQTLKLNGKINETQQRMVGVSQYIWSGINDGRERPGHIALNGTTQSWDSPPDTGDGELNHPGEDYQCRCVAIPIFAEDSAPDED